MVSGELMCKQFHWWLKGSHCTHESKWSVNWTKCHPAMTSCDRNAGSRLWVSSTLEGDNLRFTSLVSFISLVMYCIGTSVLPINPKFMQVYYCLEIVLVFFNQLHKLIFTSLLHPLTTVLLMSDEILSSSHQTAEDSSRFQTFRNIIELKIVKKEINGKRDYAAVLLLSLVN